MKIICAECGKALEEQSARAGISWPEKGYWQWQFGFERWGFRKEPDHQGRHIIANCHGKYGVFKLTTSKSMTWLDVVDKLQAIIIFKKEEPHISVWPPFI